MFSQRIKRVETERDREREIEGESMFVSESISEESSSPGPQVITPIQLLHSDLPTNTYFYHVFSENFENIPRKKALFICY